MTTVPSDDEAEGPATGTTGTTTQTDAESTTSIQPNVTKPPSLHVRIDSYHGDKSVFTRKPLSLYEKIKIVFMVVSGIAIVRIIICTLSALICYLLSLPVTCGNKDLRKPLACWRKPFQWCMFLMIRIILWGLGFWWISTNNLKKFKKSKARVIVANHHTAHDGFILWWLCGGCVASKLENKHIPLVGRMADALQTIWIDRMSKKGRKGAIKQILDHVANEEMPPLMIFPQGTCSAITTLTTFKKGAFLSGQPVQPVAIDYRQNCSADLSFVTENVILDLLYAACQFHNFCRCDFLEVHVPSEAEKEDPLKYAESVRDEIATATGSVCTQHSLGDFVMLKHAHKKDANFDTLKFVMEDVTERLLFRTRTVTKLCTRFTELDTNGDGFIDYMEFCNAAGGDPDTNQMINLFRIFGTKRHWKQEDGDLESVKSGRLCFEDFLVGVSVCFVDHMIHDAVNVMFLGNARNGKTINKADIMTIYDRIQEWLSAGGDDGADSADKEEEVRKLEMYRENMLRFSNVIFATENEQLEFEVFYQRVIDKKETAAVHQYLQMSLIKRLGIELEASDFIDEDKISMNVPKIQDILIQSSSSLAH